MNEATSCERCGKAIAAMPEGEALCCRCRYGQMVERAEPHEPDAPDMMRRNDARFLSRPSTDDMLHVCHQCGLPGKNCACHE